MLPIIIFFIHLCIIVYFRIDFNSIYMNMSKFVIICFFITNFFLLFFLIWQLNLPPMIKLFFVFLAGIFLNTVCQMICEKIQNDRQDVVHFKVHNGQVFPVRSKEVSPASRERHPRPESPEEADCRRRVLGIFNCPYKKMLNVCQFKKCYFRHAEKEAPENELLLSQRVNLADEQDEQANSSNDLPSYLCTDNLVSNIQCVTDSENVCPNGLHPGNLDDLLNLPDFESRHREQIESYYGGSIDLQCTICQEKVLSKVLSYKRWFALLEKCNHIYCVDCAQRWAAGIGGKNLPAGAISCPLCRTVSSKLIISQRYTDDESIKTMLFSDN